MSTAGTLGTLRLRRIQRGEFTYTSTDGTSVTQTPLACNPAKSLLTYTAIGGDAEPQNDSLAGEVTGSTTITFYTDSGPDVDITIAWELMEFEGEIEVQNTTILNSLGNGTASINKVNLAHAWINGGGFTKSGTNYTNDDQNSLSFNSATQIQATGTSTNADQDNYFQVVECANAFVQHVSNSVTGSSATSWDTAITGIPLDRTILLGSHHQSATANAGFDDYGLNVTFFNHRSIRSYREQTQSSDFDWFYFVVTFDEEIVRVQRGNSRQFNNTDYDISIRPVDEARTTTKLCSTCNFWPFSAGDRSTDEYKFFYHTAQLRDGARIRIRRAATSIFWSEIEWEAWEWLQIEEFEPWKVAVWANQGSGVTAAPVFDGTGDIVLVTSVDVPASATFDGTGSIVLVTQVDVPTSLTFDGSGDIVLATSIDYAATVTFDGSGDIALVTQVDVPAALTFDGSGDIVLVTSVSSNVDAFPVFDGSGDIVLVTQVDVSQAVTFDGSGDIVLATSIDYAAVVTFDGSGDIALVTSVDVPAALVFDGSGDIVLVTSVSGNVDASPVFDGSGDIVLVTQVDVPVTATFDGGGDIVLVTSIDFAVAPVFDGSGDIVLAASITDQAVATQFDGSGSLVLVTSVTGGVEEFTAALWCRYKVKNPDKLGEIALRKQAWLRQQE